MAFAAYIKEKTGYDIDIFEGLRKRVKAILTQNKIRCQEELNDIGTMLHESSEASDDVEEIEKLKALLLDVF